MLVLCFFVAVPGGMRGKSLTFVHAQLAAESWIECDCHVRWSWALRHSALLRISLIFTVVFVLPGILGLFAGICLIVSGIFAHPSRARP
jgi:hypothetical protein